MVVKRKTCAFSPGATRKGSGCARAGAAPANRPARTKNTRITAAHSIRRSSGNLASPQARGNNVAFARVRFVSPACAPGFCRGPGTSPAACVADAGHGPLHSSDGVCAATTCGRAVSQRATGSGPKSSIRRRSIPTSLASSTASPVPIRWSHASFRRCSARPPVPHSRLPAPGCFSTCWTGRGLVLACSPAAIFFDALIQKSALDLFFTCIAVALIGLIVEGIAARSSAAWLALGATVAALSLTRENALLLAAVLLGWASLRRAWRPVALFLAGMATCFSQWWLAMPPWEAASI